LDFRAATVDQVAAVAPPSIARIVRVRLDGLEPAAGALALAVAVLGDGAPLHEAADLAGIELGGLATFRPSGSNGAILSGLR
jgi:hypothetical protein